MVESLNCANNPARVASEEPANWLLTILGLEKKRAVKNAEEYKGAVKERDLQGLTPFAHARIQQTLSRVQLYGIGDPNVGLEQRTTVVVEVMPHGDSVNRIVKFKACSDTSFDPETNLPTTTFDHRGSSCTCGVPMMTGLPCVHMMKAVNKLHIPYSSLVHRYYHHDTWKQQTITPEEAVQTCMSIITVSRLQPDRDDEALHLPPLRAPSKGRPSNSSRRKSVIKDFLKKLRNNLDKPRDLNAFQAVWREIVQQEEGIFRNFNDHDDAYIEDPGAVIEDFQEETQSVVDELESAKNVEFVIEEEEIHEEHEERDSVDTSGNENNGDSVNSTS